jgi:hypothetical protein
MTAASSRCAGLASALLPTRRETGAPDALELLSKAYIYMM